MADPAAPAPSATARPEAPLFARLPPADASTPEAILDAFLGWVESAGITLYPAQEQALLELAAGKNVVLNTPTGSGKSLVAAMMCFMAVAEGRRAFYTCPIKALVSEKFFDLCRLLGADQVGMMTGDASVNRDAPVICCTAEILANLALADGDRADVDYVVMDEFHYYADAERGAAWQLPLLTLPQATFLLMSATLGETTFFEAALTRLNGRETALVRGTERPVPLAFEYSERPLHEAISKLLQSGRAPIYLVNFTQRSAAEEAQNLMSTDFCTKDEKRAIQEALRGVKFTSPYGKELQRFLRHGVGLHHAGLLPKYRRATEKLAQQGLLKIISGTDTLGVGVNVPIRTVLFTRLYKYDGQRTALLSVRDFQQVAGRAGRKGFDEQGWVVAQAPEHVIENMQAESKAAGDAKKLRKLVKAKPPDKYVHYDKATFDRLQSLPPEPLTSRFAVTPAMMLHVLGRPDGEGCAAMKTLIRDCHDTPAQRRAHGRTARSLLRSLHDGRILDLVPRPDAPHLRELVVRASLGEDFSLSRTLSLYVHETLPRLDPSSATYALDVLTLVEATLESPDVVLYAQLSKLKGEKVAELKSQGVEYDERMAELEKLEHPKPLRDFVYETFNEFRARHPWVGQENIKPKSIARDMVEQFLSFHEYVREYELHRAEGTLLRYLTDAYKALVQTVPEGARTAEIDDAITYLGAVVRGTDASLIDEWERLRRGDESEILAAEAEREDPNATPAAFDVTRDVRAFTVLVRNEAFRLVRAMAQGRWDAAAEVLADGEPAWTGPRLADAMRPYFEEHGYLRTDPDARLPGRTRITPDDEGRAWEVAQVLCDEEEATGWALLLHVDLERSRSLGKPALTLLRIEGG